MRQRRTGNGGLWSLREKKHIKGIPYLFWLPMQWQCPECMRRSRVKVEHCVNSKQGRQSSEFRTGRICNLRCRVSVGSMLQGRERSKEEQKSVWIFSVGPCVSFRLQIWRVRLHVIEQSDYLLWGWKFIFLFIFFIYDNSGWRDVEANWVWVLRICWTSQSTELKLKTGYTLGEKMKS